ncbi:hypothetical protein [Dictyobacter aurantiacus]|uniref:Zinc-finger domain-containing protein n=1 Tax=Dictyobacter aurantiacus TaxID=1936993 RepID=A0A401ZIM0_9CHLR|nr:hypothetical protein [Dictyobacter aurantiacus]GCE06678.1 hypothetical protein KDAU_40070 [Dictyobacter aurantiacus]
MECREPGAISNEELIAYLEGENVRPAVVEHLARCQKCSSQLASYRRMEHRLSQKLYRWDCPSNQVLGDFALGLVDGDHADAVQAHLRMCVLCSAEMVTLTNFMAADPLPVAVGRVGSSVVSRNASRSLQDIRRTLGQAREQTVEGARRIVALLLPPQPGFAFQRSLAEPGLAWPRDYQAEDVHISLQLESSPRQRGAWQLIGLVTRQGSAINALQGTTAQLMTAEGVVQTQHIDELGNVIFPALQPTTYTIELLLPDGVVVIDQLPVQEAR